MTFLYIYITIFTIYFTILSIVSLKPIHKIRDRYTSKDSNLCVVVYATGKALKLENLLKQLKEQDYPKNCYSIYAILDKCEDVSEVTLQSDLNVNVVNVNNLEPIGKSQAYSIIAEKLHDVAALEAYVFLDADNYVDSDFLKNINFYLTKYSVFIPMINYFAQNDKVSFWNNVKSVYHRYCNKFIALSRTRLGLTNIINTDSFIIKKDLLNKIANFDFRDLIAELNYTLKLAQENEIVAYVDDLMVYKSVSDFKFRIPSLSKRFEIFRSYIFKPQNWISREFIFSFIAPNWLVCLLSYTITYTHFSKYGFWIKHIDASTVLITFITLVIAFCMSLFSVKLYPKEFIYLFMYPLNSIWRMTYNLPPIRGIRNIIKNTTRKHVIETMTVKAFISDGKNDYPCQLNFVSDDGLAKVTFINNGKSYTTKNNHLRMIDAVRELTTKMADYGMVLKVCQCCKYFVPLVDGSTNMVKGCCNCQFKGRVQGDIIPTLIWNTCPNFEEHNVVNLF